MTKLELFMLSHGYPFEAHEMWCFLNKYQPYSSEAINSHVVALSKKIEQLKGDVLELKGRQPNH
jgi:hypothetical protein